LIVALQQELAALPNVEVVVGAPNVNQSGSSQATAGGPTVVDRYYLDGSFFGYAVHGKPANATRFGLLVLGREQAFDLVVSGINRGANVGDVSHLSGTVGAAMEALYLGVPAIAISQEREGVNTEASAKFAAQLVARYQRQGAPVGVMVSVNIPAGELKGVAVRPMGDSYLQTGAYELVEESGNRQTYESERIRVLSSDESTDTYAFQQGYITLTPLKFDWTAHEYIDEVKSWDLQLID
jgi:5'-nucleotidase